MDHSDRAFREVPHRPCTRRVPVFTLVSEGKDFRRFEITSKGRSVFGVDALGHDNLHQLQEAGV
jgi:hypothetical protein